MVKNLSIMQETQETQVQSLGGEDPLGEEMATCSSMLAWKIHGQRSFLTIGVWVYFWALYSVLLSICLSLCQYHAVLITVALQYCLESVKVMPPALFFSSRIALAILGLLWFYMNFRIICSSSVKNVVDNLIGIKSVVLEKEMATHSSVLAWRIPGTGKPVGCGLRGRTESDMTEVTWQQICSLLWVVWPFVVVVQSLTCVWFFETPWTAAHHASLSFTLSWSLLKLMSIESVMPSNHLILCHPLLLLPSIFSSIRVFSNELALHIRWPKYWSFSFSFSPSNEYSGLIFLLSKGLSRVFSSTIIQKHLFFGAQSSVWSNSHIRPWLLEKP